MITKSYVTLSYMLILLGILYMQLCNHDAFEDSSEKRVVTCQNLTVVKKCRWRGAQTWEMQGTCPMCTPRILHASRGRTGSATEI